MLVSYIVKAKALGHEHFPDGVPTILELQDRIEDAWDAGYNSTGRTETGGIKGTRKFIGTPEVSIDIRFSESSMGEKKYADTVVGASIIHESGYPVSLIRNTYLLCEKRLTCSRCDASSLSEENNMRAHDALYQDVASYYRSNCSLDEEKKIFMTDRPPIYFQHQGE